MVWRMIGAVIWSEIWMFQISLSPCAVKSANSFGMTDTSRISLPRSPNPQAKNLFSVIDYLQKRAGVQLHVSG